MKRISHIDAKVALTLILLLMISLLAMNTGYIEYQSLLSGDLRDKPGKRLLRGLLFGPVDRRYKDNARGIMVDTYSSYFHICQLSSLF